jgi:hypothetical protein
MDGILHQYVQIWIMRLEEFCNDYKSTIYILDVWFSNIGFFNTIRYFNITKEKK